MDPYDNDDTTTTGRNEPEPPQQRRPRQGRPHRMTTPAVAQVQRLVFAERLRAVRTMRLLTQAEVAALVGVDWRVAQRWEAARAMPYLRNIRRLAAALGVEPGVLQGYLPLPDSLAPHDPGNDN